MILTYIAIIIMSFLILYDIFIRCRGIIIEGATSNITVPVYTDPGMDQNPLYIATINASNIAYLKSRLDEITTFKTDLDAMKEQVGSNTTAIQGINTGLQTTSTSFLPDQETNQALIDSGTANANVPT
jgi:hypothetical protein